MVIDHIGVRIVQQRGRGYILGGSGIMETFTSWSHLTCAKLTRDLKSFLSNDTQVACVKCGGGSITSSQQIIVHIVPKVMVACRTRELQGIVG